MQVKYFAIKILVRNLTFFCIGNYKWKINFQTIAVTNFKNIKYCQINAIQRSNFKIDFKRLCNSI